VELGSDLSDRRLCPPEKIDEESVRSAFESLCNVRHDGNAGTPNLIPQREISYKISTTGFTVEVMSEFERVPPYLEIFK